MSGNFSVRLGIILISIHLIFYANTVNASEEKFVNRTILAFYDSQLTKDARDSQIHKYLELPINYHGLRVIYRDIQDKTPDLNELQGIRGVVVWFESNKIRDPSGYFLWLDELIHSGIKVVVLGNPFQLKNELGYNAPKNIINLLMANFGIEAKEVYFDLTYKTTVEKIDKQYVEFERSLNGVLPEYYLYTPIDDRRNSILVLGYGDNKDNQSHVIVLNSKGGFIDDAYIYYRQAETNITQWYVNPFNFIETAFAVQNIPKPDSTTYANRRIFYQHVNGDGWRGKSEIYTYRRKGASNSEVFFEEIVKSNLNIPVTVAPVAADIDLQWYGDNRQHEKLQQWFSLPNVEVASHTYSHPNRWQYFSKKKDEIDSNYLLEINRLAARAQRHFRMDDGNNIKNSWPRRYILLPDKLEYEIINSRQYLQSLLPQGKNISLLQWTGDMRPDASVIKFVAKEGLSNINGDFKRFQPICCYFMNIDPTGFNIDDAYQVYSSSTLFFTKDQQYITADQYLKWISFTGMPRRIKPVNLYYQMSVGHNLSGINRLKELLDKLGKQELIYINTAKYSTIAEGFNSVFINAVAHNQWKIIRRGGLQTIRFDHAKNLTINMTESIGVVGYRLQNNQLFVYLDKTIESPVIVTKSVKKSRINAVSDMPYLVHAAWDVENVRYKKSGNFSFKASGFGDVDVLWRVVHSGKYKVEATDGNNVFWSDVISSSTDGTLNITFDSGENRSIEIAVSRYLS